MAERLVLAQLVIDENGVVTGLANINTGLKQTQQESDKTGKKVEGLGGFFTRLEKRMFSMQAIAGAVLGGFTVAAAIQGLKSLIETVASADTGFALLKATTKGFYEAVVGDGTKHVTIFHDAIVRLTQVITILQIAFEELSNPQGPVGKALQMMLKFSVGGLVVTGLAKITEATETIFGELSKPGGPLERFAKRFDEIQAKANEAATAVKAVRVAEATGLESETVKGTEFNPFQAQRVDEATGRQTGVFGGVIRIAGQASLAAPQIKTAMDEAVGSIRNANIAWVEHNKALRDVTISSLALGAAYGTIASSFNAWVEGGSISGRKFLHDLLSQIAQQAAVKSIFELAEGFAALASTWGVPNPAAAGHFTASAIFAGVAAATGIGARKTAGAGGASGGAGAKAGFAPDTVAQNQRAEQSHLTVIIQGNVIGQEQYVRKLVVDIQNSLRAGAGGGGL